MKNRISQLFGIEYPIIQGGMVWCAGWKLASAVSNAGGLGIIGAGSMYPDILRIHVRKCKKATSKPFAVNLPLIYPDINKHIETIVEEGVKVVFTSAGNPKTWTTHLQSHNIKVVHVVPSTRLALKSQQAGVDAVVAEGFEAGGHNGREETTTLCLIPMVRQAIDIPLIAAGGIATGSAMLAALVLGADGVQMGSRFVASVESSAHQAFKQKMVTIGEGVTQLSLKKLVPVRLIKNEFYNRVAQAEATGATEQQLAALLGKGRAKRGMFEGELEQGELEIGQVAALINDIKPAAQIVDDIWNEFLTARKQICTQEF